MLRIHIQDRARRDLIEIWQYSHENWGEAQADLYLDELEKSFTMIADNSSIGVRYDFISKGLRKIVVKKHLVMYRITPEMVRIVRVLGAAMDVDAHV